MEKRVKYYDAVHIEDNLLIRLNWKLTAKELMINLLSLENPINIENYFEFIDLNKTVFYIDQNFENSDIKGIEYAKMLVKKGVKNISITTNDQFQNKVIPFPILDKNCPWNYY